MVKYAPKGHGKDKAHDAVRFTEAEPPSHLRSIVHRYLCLKTDGPLPEDFRFHALPDACSYLVFDQRDPQVTGASMLRNCSEEFNLGRDFHFVNVRLFPGVWQIDREAISYGQVNGPYTGDLPLLDYNRRLIGQDFETQQTILSELVWMLVQQNILATNVVTQRILSRIDDINSVSAMASASAISPRQLQRILKRTTGFAPHDFLKVLRLQKALGGNPTGQYADQSHFIHSFRRATSYTPGRFAKKYDV